MSDQLNVFLNGNPVGIYERESDGRETFEYRDEWLEDGYPLSFHLPLQDRTFKKNEFAPVFENLLPDNPRHRQSIADNEHASSAEMFDLLEIMGEDCVGGLQFLTPEAGEPNAPWSLELKELSRDQFESAILDLNSDNPRRVDRENRLSKSVAGQHVKATFFQYPDGDTWYDPIGTTPSTHIIKPQDDDVFFDLNENEYFTMTLADNMNLPVCDVDFERIADRCPAVIVRRFDRTWGEQNGERALYRRHQEDFCQALGRPSSQKKPGKDDQTLMLDCFDLIKKTNNPPQNQLHFLNVQMFQFFMGCEDGHLKNYSLFLGRSTDEITLTPFYDISSVDPYDRDNPESVDEHPNEDLRMSQDEFHIDPYMNLPLGISGKRTLSDIDAQDFLDIHTVTELSEGIIEQMLESYTNQLPEMINRTIEETSDDVPERIYRPIRHAACNRVKRIREDLNPTQVSAPEL